MEKQKIIISEDVREALREALEAESYDRLFVLTDETTRELCLPLVEEVFENGRAQGAPLLESKVITIGATDQNKTVESISHVWKELGEGGGTRHSLMINLGGGMVTDLGGFAASTFKRGIRFINIPTTLLAMVDASVGGKTGINFNGLKNEIGVFSNARSVILDTEFLKTMDGENMRSGYAEMIKHGLISNEEMWAELMLFDIGNPDLKKLNKMVAESVAVKEKIVDIDPTEKGIRKALNLGHTVGHALESFALKHHVTINGKQLLHGYAVAYGMVCELYLSAKKTGFPSEKLHQTVGYIKENYGKMDFSCDDYGEILEFMTHDKKNTAGIINFTLLGAIGDIRINQTATKEDICEALDFYREI